MKLYEYLRKTYDLLHPIKETPVGDTQELCCPT